MEPLNPTHVAWSANIFRTIRDGGVWGIPRSGLLFQKRGNALALTARMPHDPAMPITSAQLREQQDSDYEGTVLHFGAAGITVTDETTP
jgi:hypothetical protein